MPAGSVYAAPQWAPLGSADWKLVGHTTDGVTMTEPFTLDSDEAQLRLDGVREWPRSVTIPSGGWQRSDLWPDEVAAISKRMAERWLDSQYSYSMPSRWLLGCTDPNINERSKPVGLTTSHEYTDRDGDRVIASFAALPYATACLKVEDGEAGDSACVYVNKEDSIPLALNVLGHDRPHSLTDPGVTVGGQSLYSVTIDSKTQRDKALAAAIAGLKSVDLFDQREVERKEFEAKAAAKRDAEYAKHKQESFDRAKRAYADAIRDQIASGIDAESAAKVQAALSAYETARRKLEGLPS